MNDSTPNTPTEAPSRRDNPFATCWTRPGALAFRFGRELTAEKLVARLLAQNCCGAIVGPHGSGKSTLLESLKPALIAAGLKTHAISLRDRQRFLPREFFESWKGGDASRHCQTRPIVIIDGYEQLHGLERW